MRDDDESIRFLSVAVAHHVSKSSLVPSTMRPADCCRHPEPCRFLNALATGRRHVVVAFLGPVRHPGYWSRSSASGLNANRPFERHHASVARAPPGLILKREASTITAAHRDQAGAVNLCRASQRSCRTRRLPLSHKKWPTGLARILLVTLIEVNPTLLSTAAQGGLRRRRRPTAGRRSTGSMSSIFDLWCSTYAGRRSTASSLPAACAAGVRCRHHADREAPKRSTRSSHRLGADDYITKPFSLRSSRAGSRRLRRAEMTRPTGPPDEARWSFGELRSTSAIAPSLPR